MDERFWSDLRVRVREVAGDLNKRKHEFNSNGVENREGCGGTNGRKTTAVAAVNGREAVATLRCGNGGNSVKKKKWSDL